MKMRKLVCVTLTFLISSIIGLSTSHAFTPGVNQLGEAGSLLVFPLIDDIQFKTHVQITNDSDSAVTLKCYIVTGVNEDVDSDSKDGFWVDLTGRQTLRWNTATGLSPAGDNIQMFVADFRIGYMFCFAVTATNSDTEITHNHLRGVATLINPFLGQAWSYNAIPSQRDDTNPAGDTVLDLDGLEYSPATSKITFGGFPAGLVPGLDGILAVANIGFDLTASTQPAFSINFRCFNQDGGGSSTHLVPYVNWEQYRLSDELGIDTSGGTTGFYCETTSTMGHALWAVYYTNVVFGDPKAAGGNVGYDRTTVVPTVVTQ